MIQTYLDETGVSMLEIGVEIQKSSIMEVKVKKL